MVYLRGFTLVYIFTQYLCPSFPPNAPVMLNPQLYAGKVILAPMVRIGTLPMRLLAKSLGAGKKIIFKVLYFIDFFQI